MKNQKYIFLYALILTLVVFNIGIFMGYKLEASRIDKIDNLYLEAEMELLDQRIQKDALDIMNLDCEILVQENIKFADRIFEEALFIKKYEDSNKINKDIEFQHKRFDLLRTLFWINSIRIKEKCNSDYKNIVYFYDYINPSVEQKARQKLFSNVLSELKEKFGNKVMLIPIAGDNEIPSIDLLIQKYNVTQLPTILINEEIQVTELEEMEDIEKYLN